MNRKTPRLGRIRVLALLGAMTTLGVIVSHAGAAAVQTWGRNKYGQLGNGSTGERTEVPGNLIGMENGVTSAAAGADFTLAVQDGAVYAWGRNSNGQLGNDTTTDSTVPVAVTGLGDEVTAVATGGRFSLALRNGAVYGWGDNKYSVLGVDYTGEHSISQSQTPIAIDRLGSGVTRIAAGAFHGLAIKSGGVYAWGFNANGQLGYDTAANTYSDTPQLISKLASGVTLIAGSGNHSMAVKDGALYTWGDNTKGQLGDGLTTNRNMPAVVDGFEEGVTLIAAGEMHSLAVMDGDLYAWGDNLQGQLGIGSRTDSYTPMKVTGITGDIIALGTARDSSYAITSDGSLWVWGDNQYSQFGLGPPTITNDSNTIPQPLLPPEGYRYTAIAAGNRNYHTVALLSLAPEPGGLGLLALGGLGLLMRRRRGSRQGL